MMLEVLNTYSGLIGAVAEILAAIIALSAILISIEQFKSEQKKDREFRIEEEKRNQKSLAYGVNAWIEVKKEGGAEFYSLYLCNNSSGPIRNVKIKVIWNGVDLTAPTINTYPIIPVGNFVTSYCKEKKYFTYLKRVETEQDYSPICIQPTHDKYKVKSIGFIDTFSTKWARFYDSGDEAKEDLIRNAK